MSTRPTWAEVSRSRLLHNHDALRRLAGRDTEVLCVVKANAYGHGLTPCAETLEGNGARWFGVTSVEEGVALRRVAADARIVIMSGICEGEAGAALENDLTPVVWEPVHLSALEAAAKRLRAAPGDCPVHLEIDTGMSRQGVQREKAGALLDRFTAESPLKLEGLMTHFHTPESKEANREQINELVLVVSELMRRGIKPELVSAGSSANLLQSDDVLALTDLAVKLGGRRMVRAGIALYGYSPLRGSAAAGMHGEPEPYPDTALNGGLKPVLEWKTRVVSLREIPAGATVGYDATFTAKRPTKLALLPVGYADGLSRLLSNQGEVLVRGQRAPVAGRISMDHTSVDVTDVAGVELGDEVALIGRQGEQMITAKDMAKLAGTISYEVLCDIAARVPRVMVD